MPKEAARGRLYAFCSSWLKKKKSVCQLCTFFLHFHINSLAVGIYPALYVEIKWGHVCSAAWVLLPVCSSSWFPLIPLLSLSLLLSQYRFSDESWDLPFWLTLTLRSWMPHICGFLDCFSFSHFLATSCCF